MSHVGRVLRNALVTGGLAAGGTALIQKGLDNTVGAVDKDNLATGGPGNEGPLSVGLKDALFSKTTAVGSGALGLGLTHGFNSVGAGRSEREKFLNALKHKATISDSDILGKSVKDIDQLIRDKALVPEPFRGAPFAAPDPSKLVTDQKLLAELQAMRRGAGMVGGDTALKRIASLVTRRGPLSTFGQTTGRRIGRGGLGLVAAALPALVGSVLTDDTRSE